MKPDWMAHGACLGLPTDIFYPEKGVTAPEAKRVCSGCVVRAACLKYGLENWEAGIWGGTSEIERRTIRRRGRRERAAARARLDTP